MTTTRRAFVQASTLLASGVSVLPGRAASESYKAAAERIWPRGPTDAGGPAAQRREWVRLATLAASSHNTQPWKFRLQRDTIVIAPDYERRCKVVDPDDSHLFRSLGCAAENLVHAAAADGFAAQVRFDAAQDAVVVSLEPSAAAKQGSLSAAIFERRCTRTPYDGQAISASAQTALAAAATLDGVTPMFLQGKPQMETMLDYVRQGNLAQFDDPAFVNELRDWIRFNEADAVASGDGLAGIVSGRPSLPGWLGRALFGFIASGKQQSELDAKAIRSSAGIVVFVSDHNDKAGWVAAGRAYERFALQASALEIRNAFINQPVEVRHLRPQLLDWLGIPQKHVQLIVRFGHGQPSLRSLRRPLDAVLVEG